jgi:hypothetical protein
VAWLIELVLESFMTVLSAVKCPISAETDRTSCEDEIRQNGSNKIQGWEQEGNWSRVWRGGKNLSATILSHSGIIYVV